MKDKNYRPEEQVVIEKAATLKIELSLKPGLTRWMKQGIMFRSEVPIDLPVEGPIWPHFEAAMRQAFDKFRVDVIEPASKPIRGRRN